MALFCSFGSTLIYNVATPGSKEAPAEPGYVVNGDGREKKKVEEQNAANANGSC